MRKKIVAANWKMNMTQAESARFVESLLLDLGDITDIEVVIVPPFTAIAKVTEALGTAQNIKVGARSEEHTSELQSHSDLVCRLLLEKKTNWAHSWRRHGA